ncbi:MAG: hypothetical protein JSW27_09830 [Phycisphaerales bacterium]|nr:MAG: hypothetical protein JSW27_09830 [Phycisphaerales bacterium]
MTVRILRILGVLALIATAAVSVLCLINGKRSADILALSVIERFKQEGGRKDQSGAPLSPLVQQAQLLATYLNPPPAPKPKTAASPAEEKENRAVALAPEIKPANMSPKFKLHGISYRPSRPEDSMALIWEAGAGHRWVREGTQLGHVTIVEIDGDSVLYTDGTNTLAMALDLKQGDVLSASGRKQRRPARHSDESRPVVAHWAPVRRIRQIPSARAAQRGVVASDGEMETP